MELDLPARDNTERDAVLRTGIQRAEAAMQAREPLPHVLAHLTATVEALADQPVVASILILDNEGLLRNGASPNLPADYLTAIDRIKPDPHLGTCAAVAATGKRVVTRSFTDDNKWAELRHLPLAIGFLGAWSEPILASTGEVLGTFGTYFRQQREPTEQEIAVVEALVPVAARALASARAGTG